jgi:hypothetical protein
LAGWGQRQAREMKGSVTVPAPSAAVKDFFSRQPRFGRIAADYG